MALSKVPAAAMSSGSIVQVVSAKNSSATGSLTSSTSWVDTGLLTINITPKLANSKIYVFMGGMVIHTNVGSNYGPVYTIFRSVNGGSFSNVTTGALDGNYRNAQSSGAWDDWMAKLNYVDTPTYTLGQQVTYKPYIRKSNSGTDTWINHQGGIGNNTGSFEIHGFAMEIAG